MEWPSLLTRAPNYAWRQSGRVIVPSPSFGGAFRPRRSADGGGRWRCTLSDVYLNKRELIKLARAIEVEARGGMNRFVLRTCECVFAPYLAGASTSGVPHDDDTPFNDDAPYFHEGIAAEVNASAPLNATSLRIELTYSAPFIGGEAFSIVHPNKGEHRYHVGRVTEGEDGVQTVSIWPELREAVTGGECVNLANPGCVVWLTNTEEFLNDINMNRRSGISAVFEEWLDDVT